MIKSINNELCDGDIISLNISRFNNSKPKLFCVMYKFFS